MTSSCYRGGGKALIRQFLKAAGGGGQCSIKLVCLAFRVSSTCYRYQPRLAPENAEIADKLIQLTYNQRNWGFGLCFLYLRNVKGASAGTTSGCTGFTAS